MLGWSSNIIMQHLLLVLTFIFIPAIGRVVQTNGLGNISTSTYWLLEFPVEGARILFLLLLIGDGKIDKGIELLISMFRMTKDQWKTVPTAIINNLKLHSTELLITTFVFVLVALALNYLIKYAANSEEFLFKLQQFSLLRSFNSQSLTLFLKNLTVIPFTILFEVWLILRLLNKI